MCLWVSVFMGIFAHIGVGACTAVCVISCVCGGGGERGEERKRLGQSKIKCYKIYRQDALDMQREKKLPLTKKIFMC